MEMLFVWNRFSVSGDRTFVLVKAHPICSIKAGE